MSGSVFIVCARCGQEQRHQAHGWCTTCYDRWLRYGKPDWPKGVPPGGVRKPAPARVYAFASALGRIEDYTELRFEQGYTIAGAAERLGVSRRTADRYEAVLRERAAGQEVA